MTRKAAAKGAHQKKRPLWCPDAEYAAKMQAFERIEKQPAAEKPDAAAS